MNGMYVTGGNIDGGTYPADIWGTYMKKAAGKYCGGFKRPTEPFSSQPFQGHYARQGGKEEDSDGEDPSGAQIPEPGTETEPENGTGGNGDTNRGGNNGNGRGNGNDTGGDNGAAFDPNQYETPPQGAPETQSPGGGTQAPGDG
jgi:penicillin-binding protein 1A